MKFFALVTLLIIIGVAALFVIKHNDALLLGAIVALIAGFFASVSLIATEK